MPTCSIYRAEIVFRHPKRSDAWNAFLEPFENNLWYGLISAITVSAMVLLLAFRLEKKFSLTVSRTSQEYFLTIFGFVCQQGYTGLTFLRATKAIMLVVLLFSVLMYQFYGACIIGSLLTSPPKNIRTIRQLIHSSLQVTIEDLFYLWEFYNVQHKNMHSPTQLIS